VCLRDLKAASLADTARHLQQLRCNSYCDTMTGFDKTKCLVEEARKDANPATLQTPD